MSGIMAVMTSQRRVNLLLVRAAPRYVLQRPASYPPNTTRMGVPPPLPVALASSVAMIVASAIIDEARPVREQPVQWLGMVALVLVASRMVDGAGPRRAGAIGVRDEGPWLVGGPDVLLQSGIAIAVSLWHRMRGGRGTVRPGDTAAARLGFVVVRELTWRIARRSAQSAGTKS